MAGQQSPSLHVNFGLVTVHGAKESHLVQVDEREAAVAILAHDDLLAGCKAARLELMRGGYWTIVAQLDAAIAKAEPELPRAEVQAELTRLGIDVGPAVARVREAVTRAKNPAGD